MGVIEAQAMGLPVIVTNIPGPIDAMRKNVTGKVIKVKNSDNLYDAMKDLKENRTLRETYSTEAIKFIKDNFEQQKLFSYILEDRKRIMDL